MQKQLAFVNSPLGIISLFIVLCEGVLVYGISSLSGTLQWVLAISAIVVIFISLGLFFLVLFTKPYLFYPPSEYGQFIKPGEFIAAMKGTEKIKPQAEQTVAKTEEVGTLTIQAEGLDLVDKNEVDPHQSPDAFDLFMDQKYQEARDAFLELAKKSDDDNKIEFYRALAAHSLSFFEFSKSVAEFEKLLEKAIYHHIYYWYAASYVRIKQFSKSNEILNRGINNIKDIDSQQALILSKINLNIINGEYDQAEIEAVALAENAITSSRKAKAYRILGEIYRKKNKPQDAIQFYFNAYKADPSDEINLQEIASFFNEQNDFKYELFFRLEAVKLQGTESNYVFLGNCYLSNNLNNLSMRSYTKASELAETESTWIPANIGNLFNNLGLYDLAILNLKKALEIYPSDEYSIKRLSSAYLNLQQERDKEKSLLEDVKIQ